MKASDILKLASGGTGAALRLDDAAYTRDVTDPADASISFTLSNAGALVALADFGSSYDWITGASPSDYEVLATLLSGTVSTGTTGSWLPLSSTRVWTVDRTTLGTKAATVKFEIGLVGTSTALIAGTISMTSTVSA